MRLGPGDDRALGDREAVVGDDEVLVEHQFLAEAVAGRAGALRRVEAEQPRLDLGDGEAGDGAGEFLGEDDAAGRGVVELERPCARRPFSSARGDSGRARLPRRVVGRVGRVEIGEAFGELERRLEAVGEARLDAFADDDAVDHHLDVVLVFLVERGGVLDRVELAVDADAGEAGLLPLGELLAILALAAADDRARAGNGGCLRAGPSRGRPSG